MATQKKTSKPQVDPAKVQIPVQRKGDKILAQRDGFLKWFTETGWSLLGDINIVDAKGNPIRKQKQGWVQVDPASLNPAPPPVKKTNE